MWRSLSCCVTSCGPTSWPQTHHRCRNSPSVAPRAGTASPTATLHDFTSSTWERDFPGRRWLHSALTVHYNHQLISRWLLSPDEGSVSTHPNQTQQILVSTSDLTTLLYIKLRRTKSKQRGLTRQSGGQRSHCEYMCNTWNVLLRLKSVTKAVNGLITH